MLRAAVLSGWLAWGAPAPDFDECLSSGAEDARPLVGACERWLDDTARPQSDRTKLYIHLAMLHAQWDELVKANQYLETALLRDPGLLEDNLYRYNWLRQKGIIELRQEDYRAALPYFEAALQIVRRLGRDLLAATVHNDLGTIHREMGNYRASLAAFERSLELLKAGPADYRSGLTLANIAGVYRDMGSVDEARLYLDRALAIHRRAQQADPDSADYIESFIAHVYEDLGATEMAAGELATAAAHLDDAARRYRQLTRNAELARVLVLKGRLANAQGDPEGALAILDEATELVRRLEQRQLLELEPELARVYLQLGRAQEARAIATGALARARETRQARIALSLQRLLVDIHTSLNEPELALAAMKDYVDGYEKLLEAKFAQDFSALRTRIEIDEQRKANELLEKDNEIAALTVSRQRIALLSAGMLVLLAGTIVTWVWRNKRRAEAHLHGELAAHRSELMDLSRQSGRLLDLLDSTPYPLLCIDEGGRIVHANAACRDWFPKPFADGDNLRAVDPELLAQVTRIDPDTKDTHELTTAASPDGARATVSVRSLDQSDGYRLILIQSSEDAATATAALAQIADQSQRAAEENRAAYRQALVDLMLACVNAWEAVTGDDRIALAEQSSIWQVAIDDGRVRTRTMEKYLSLQRLPQRPRWRQVVRTCRYILLNCQLSAAQRRSLEELLEGFLRLERSRALES
ncbi:MAG: tetratricopeptide repeat protein [Pseudomonadota bacterium]